ncbi:hypothetical protein ICM_00361 [Bacillus cereus BAG1X2-3]|uniref:DUF7660 domain-containing protein n=1 Tax=Bacillus cereus TaxID=1396 RepID=A0A9X7HNT1_BACCE|nr:hypothetical protein [Bacillus cereus]EOO26055.1 hypothetical protein ICC_04458 [Bacillus cereus BAG1X1-1]EOO49390.1 hypothetical protein ICK_04429 [Bacillus cereus BAG1X2-2]EOO52038.1 hypothetical protein ICI_00924 [Bacillus cereus BAG1X2-1]EOO61449.1 hypothetical protein ICM_00361 [Bacillus cereus BAG1X2-3]EOP08749.1 hypothetical protein ICO_00927 [Bacillus cereus BAG2O-1]
MDVYELISDVDSKEKLLEFLFHLQKDFKENQDEWENITLEDYLESMEAWGSGVKSDVKGIAVDNHKRPQSWW